MRRGRLWWRFLDNLSLLIPFYAYVRFPTVSRPRFLNEEFLPGSMEEVLARSLQTGSSGKMEAMIQIGLVYSVDSKTRND